MNSAGHPSTGLKLGNGILVALQILFFLPAFWFAVAGREHWTEFSDPDGPLMGSWLLEHLGGWPLAAIASVILAASLVKGFWLKSARKRLVANAIGCIVLYGLSSTVIILLMP